MADAMVKKHGTHGLQANEEIVLQQCVELFGNTWFTVSMLCLATARSADDCIEVLTHLHRCGCIRKPVNDGGQEYFEVMPGIVTPKQRIGG